MSSQPLEFDTPNVAQRGRETERERIVAAIEADEAQRNGPQGRLAELADRFGLDPLETDVVGVLWAAAYDPELRAAVVAIDGFAAQVTVRAVAVLFGHAMRVRLSSGSPLLMWRLVTEHELVDGGAALMLDPTILAWLDGEHELDRAFAGRARLLPAGPELSEWPLDAIASRLKAGLHAGKRWRLRIVTEDALAAGWFAAAVGLRVGLPVLALKRGTDGETADEAIRLHRQAYLDGCAPFFPVDDLVLGRPTGVSPYPLQIVHGTGTIPDQADDVGEIDVVLDPPGPDARERLWRRLWPESATWPHDRLTTLALCHEASVGDIAAVAARGPVDVDAASDTMREQLRGEADPLVRRIDAVFGWDDLVLPKQTRDRLDAIAFEARERARLWSDPGAARLFPYGRGLTTLFAGPPGTGKTMAAQVIAADLGLDLLAVDLSAVVSKWVGETAQHLQQLLSSPASRRSILFFDEADALYAKRVEDVRDAQDRFANQDSSHLMTALEAYPGIVILATNLKGNIDTAFLRRIRHVIDFERPDEQARAEIWARAITTLFPQTQARKLTKQLVRLAAIEASGALIKNAALSALFEARRSGAAPTIRLLGEMLARELTKEGVGISTRDLDSALGSDR